MDIPSHVSFLTRLLINLLRNRKDVLALTVEILLPEGPQIPENTSYYDEDIDELLAEQSANTIDTLNRIYNSPHSGRS
tara:strand:- start:840 stop:1073 length:234 start_codon:yes stop_codon:yes gene_type:complete